MKRFIEKQSDGTYDIVVIGGGITGAAVAYDAATRGLSVALVEKSDFGGATSAATSKFIHGGLRYLKTFEFGLVRESLRERRIMENIAPNFVYPVPIMFTNPSAVMKIGLLLYDILAFDKGFTWDRGKRIPNHHSISREEVIAQEPNAKRDGLRGAGIYYDCINICPERLTLTFIKSALHFGADVANYTKAEDFIFEGGRVAGVVARDLADGATRAIRGACIVNCSGPWADEVLGIAKKGAGGSTIRRSEGIHLIVKKRTGIHAVGTMTGSTHFFLIPWRGHSLIGTTDKEYPGDPDSYHVTRKSIEELLDTVNADFGNNDPIRYEDVLFAYGGLRPLLDSKGDDIHTTTRKYEIHDHAAEGLPGLITAEGGKYTTSRNLAQSVMTAAARVLGRSIGRCVTHRQRLIGCDIDDVEGFIVKAREENPDFSPQTIDYLARHYGTEYAAVLEMARRDMTLAEPVDADGEILAEVSYAAAHEMALTLNDILFRRTGIGTLGHPGEAVVMKVADIAARTLGWNAEKRLAEIQKAEKAFKLPD
jgi:glycerol-3-phosphate dehydrogenase